jgi:hypothetical protein
MLSSAFRKYIVSPSKRKAGDGVPYRKNKYNEVLQNPE